MGQVPNCSQSHRDVVKGICKPYIVDELKVWSCCVLSCEEQCVSEFVFVGACVFPRTQLSFPTTGEFWVSSTESSVTQGCGVLRPPWAPPPEISSPLLAWLCALRAAILGGVQYTSQKRKVHVCPCKHVLGIVRGLDQHMHQCLQDQTLAEMHPYTHVRAYAL